MPVDVFQLLRSIGGRLVIPIHISIIWFYFPLSNMPVLRSHQVDYWIIVECLVIIAN